MRRNFWTCLALVIVITGMIFTASCQKKVDPGKLVETGGNQESITSTTGASGTSGTESTTGQSGTEMSGSNVGTDVTTTVEYRSSKESIVTSDIFFDYDKSELRPESKVVLNKIADFMKKYPGSSLLIEGHCDARGTEAYNLALGERRANSARDYIKDLGVGVSRIQTKSMGEEMANQAATTEAEWKMDRRDHFVVND